MAAAGANGKGALAADEAEEARKETCKEAAAVSLCVANGIFMTATMMILPARAPMVLSIMGGDAAKAARTLGLMSSLGAALELLLNPVFGCLSDQYGRKPFLLLAPATRAVLHSLAAALPKSLPMQFVDRIVGAAMVFTFQAPITAALTDLYSGPKLAVAMARNQTFFGLGCAVGPFIGARLGGAKAFACSALVFASSILWLSLRFPETLTSEAVKPFDIAACNPLRFLRLFNSKRMFALASTIGLQSFGDYPNLYDFNFLYLKTVFGWGQNEVGSFATVVGVTQIFGGEAMGQLINALGQKMATLVGNMSYLASLGILGTSRTIAQLGVSLAAMTFGHARNIGVSTYLQKHGQGAGMGRAEIVSAQMNLVALIKVVAPILYGNIFSWATSKGRSMPGFPYLVVCAFMALAQFVFVQADADGESKR